MKLRVAKKVMASLVRAFGWKFPCSAQSRYRWHTIERAAARLERAGL